MRKKVQVFLLVTSILGWHSAVSQEVVTGRVTATDGEPLPGIPVMELWSQVGTITDLDGRYSLEVDTTATLVISSLGFITEIIDLYGRTTLNVVLQEDLAELEGVLVIGYGTRKKSHLTGAISRVENKNLDQLPFARVDDALIGQVAGVQISTTSEAGVGDSPSLLVRGVGSINAGSGPLVVIDGSPVDSDFLGNIDMNDIQSFEILKDAASASIYGSRGANGVLMITTKDGKEGPPIFYYNGYTGFQEAYRSDAYSTTIDEHIAFELDATGELSDKTLLKEAIGFTDWQDVYFERGRISSHALSLRGGTAKTSYSSSLSYLHDQGVLLVDDYKRVNFRAKVNTEISKKLSVGFNVNPSYSVRRRFTDALRQLLRADAPWLPKRHTEHSLQFVNNPLLQVGDYAMQEHFDNVTTSDGLSAGVISISGNASPLARILEKNTTDNKLKVLTSINGKYEIDERFNLTSQITASIQNTVWPQYDGILHSEDVTEADASETYQNRVRLIENLFLNYTSKKFMDHQLDFVAGVALEQERERLAQYVSTGFSSDLVPSIEGGTYFEMADGFTRERRLMSFISRANYAYADKYLSSVSVRYDGSSVFGEDRKFGVFPAFSVGWRLSEEGFLQQSSFLSELKLRGSYGVTGNDDISLENSVQEWYAYLAILEVDQVATGSGSSQTVNPINIRNDNLRWEKSIELNYGLDFGLLGNRINGSVEAYRRTSSDLLLDVPVSSTVGFTSALENIGEVKNQGVEITLSSHNIHSDNFHWKTSIIASMNENTLTDFGDAEGTVITPSDGNDRNTEWIISVGNPISNFYGYVYDEEIPAQYLNAPYEIMGAKPGQVYAKDLNQDGIIDEDDRAILGNPYPELIWSFNNELSFKNFDFSFLWQGSHGAETRNIADLEAFSLSRSQNLASTDVPNPELVVTRVLTNDIIQDASYIALRNVMVGYTFPGEKLERLKLNSARVYLAGSNLVFMKADDFTGFNPESVRLSAADGFTSLTYGYNRGGSPITRKVTIGINVSF